MEQNASKDEIIGFHKGALSTLAKEREEFQKLLNVVEQLMQMHIKALKEQGVDLMAQAQQVQQQNQTPQQQQQPLDDMLNK
jgi:biotin operon repressor